MRREMKAQPPATPAGQKKSAVFLIVLFAVAAIGAVSTWRLQYDFRQVRTAQRALVRQRQELRRLEAREPAPTAESCRRIEADLESAKDRLAEVRALFGVPSRPVIGAAGDVAATRASDYFEIESFVTRMRIAAAESRVALIAEERFGFDEYAHAGPASAAREQVLSDRCSAEKLLVALYASGPARLDTFDRQQSVTRATDVADRNGTSDTATSIGASGGLHSTTFQVSFVGETTALRALLNRLAEARSAMIVRSVAVQPADQSDSAASRLSTTGATTAEIRHGLSRFTVAVEVFELRGESQPQA